MIPFLDLQRQHEPLRPRFIESLGEVLSASSFIGGSALERFEQAFADFCGVRYCVGTSNGTDALKLALIAAGISGEDEVILPANSFVATAEAIIDAGARPVLADVDPDTGLMTPDTVRPRISSRTSAIVPVHLFGSPCDMDGLMSLASSKGLVVIEDSAQAHGATFKGRKAGSFGLAGCFSFYPGKNLGALGDGGAVVTDSQDVAGAVRALRDHGQTEKSRHQQIGFTARLDTIQAAFLSTKLERLAGWNAARRERAERYRAGLAETPAVSLLATMPRAESVYHLFAILHESRDALRQSLASRDIQTGIHYPRAIHQQEAYTDLGAPGEFPVSESLTARILSLPMFPELTLDEVDEVVDAIGASV